MWRQMSLDDLPQVYNIAMNVWAATSSIKLDIS
jgi:hypothetical protein